MERTEDVFTPLSRQPADLLVPNPPGEPAGELNPADETVIDQALEVVGADYHRLTAQVVPFSLPRPLDLEKMRRGPLGQALRRLALAARGQVREPKGRVLIAIDSVVPLFFWPASADGYAVPRSF
jgi:hypothetical protein